MVTLIDNSFSGVTPPNLTLPLQLIIKEHSYLILIFKINIRETRNMK